ncbi:ABC transporter B family member 11 [Linum perenne]
MEDQDQMPSSSSATTVINNGGNAKTVRFTKLFSFADKTDVLLMVLGTIGSVANGFATPLRAVVLGKTIDSFGTMNQSDQTELVHAISEAILRQDIAFFDGKTSTGEVIGRMSGDTVLIQEAMGEKVGKFLQMIATFLGGFAIAFIQGWHLALVMFATIPLIVITVGTMYTVNSAMTARVQQAYADAGTLVEQTIGSIRTVASFTGEKQAVGAYDKFLERAYESGVKEGVSSGIGMGMAVMIVYCNFGFGVWYAGKLIVHRGYSGGQMLSVIVSILNASNALGQAAPVISAFATGKAAAYKMFETVNRRPSIDVFNLEGKTLQEIKGDIDFKQVNFSYPARPDERIFSSFSLSIPRGTTVALVGESGSGKSTVISLIERFYDPQSGEVLIDGINLKEFQLKWIRQQIGLVSQEPVLFASSIRDNISYGKYGASNEEIKAVIELANAAKFIHKLPQGIDTMIGEHGTQLSGGQKQRIAIARAILKNPRILLLDEATSALDAESERIVQNALDRIMVERTTVIVAHRLTTVRNADSIVVIHRGKIVERGSHTRLIEDSEGAYSQLIRLQEVNKEAIQEEAPEITVESPPEIAAESSCETTMLHQDEFDKLKATREEKLPDVPVTRLAYLNKPELPALVVGTIAACVNGSIMPIYGLLISKAIKSFFETPHQVIIHTRFWALMFMTLGFAALLVHPLRSYFFAVAGSRLIQRIRSLCFEKVVHTEIGWFDEAEHSSGAIGARLSADAAIMRTLVGDALGMNVQTVATAAIGVIIAFTASWQLALVILMLLPLTLINGFAQVKFMKGFSADAKVMYEEASQVANDAVGSIRTVASFCAEEKVMQLYRKRCEMPMKIGVFFALTMVSTGVAQSNLGIDTSKAKAATASVFSIIDRKSRIDPSDESGTTLEDVEGEIEFVHVSFKYPSRPDVQIFRDINLAIHSGQTVALVGESGSGKSTVLALLQRLYDPDSGHITLDGIEINKLQLKWLRKQMGLVGQEPSMFNDTIRANIAYGKQGNATEAEIVSASELANAHMFISGLQQGYDTIVGERGIQLSGGQKQRVAIARAMVKDPKILLLDEATSALDAESERVVQDALDRVMVSRTTIVVAHRLSTVKNANMIAVVKNGVIVEKGSHESLMSIKGGDYASLVALHSNAKTA